MKTILLRKEGINQNREHFWVIGLEYNNTSTRKNQNGCKKVLKKQVAEKLTKKMARRMKAMSEEKINKLRVKKNK